MSSTTQQTTTSRAEAMETSTQAGRKAQVEEQKLVELFAGPPEKEVEYNNVKQEHNNIKAEKDRLKGIKEQDDATALDLESLLLAVNENDDGSGDAISDLLQAKVVHAKNKSKKSTADFEQARKHAKKCCHQKCVDAKFGVLKIKEKIADHTKDKYAPAQKEYQAAFAGLMRNDLERKRAFGRLAERHLAERFQPCTQEDFEAARAGVGAAIAGTSTSDRPQEEEWSKAQWKKNEWRLTVSTKEDFI